jgi:hypothetical protein
MIQPHRFAPALSLNPVMVRRRRPLMIAPPAGRGLAVAADPFAESPADTDWMNNLRFFCAAYAAGLLFFLIMLS